MSLCLLTDLLKYGFVFYIILMWVLGILGWILIMLRKIAVEGKEEVKVRGVIRKRYVKGRGV
jgi:hypothetical protein